MGRPSKKKKLISYIINKNHLNVEDEELRVKRKDVLSDEELGIASSTLYKLVNESEFLEIKEEYIFFKRRKQDLKRMDKIITTIYKNYDPAVGQLKQSFKSLFPTENEQLELKPYIQEIADDYKFYQLDNDEIKFTESGVQLLQDIWGEQKKENLELCEICLKPLTNQEPVRFSTNMNEFDDSGIHASCLARSRRESYRERYDLICGYCTLPLNVNRYEYQISSTHYSFLQTIKYHLLQMEPIEREKIISLALKNYMVKGFEEFKNERVNYKQEKAEKEEEYLQKKQEGKLTKVDKFLYKLFTKLGLPDTVDTMFQRFFDDYKIGAFFDDLDPEEVFQSIIAYQLAEYQASVEHRSMINKEIRKFCEFTGLFPYKIDENVNVRGPDRSSPLNSSFPEPWDSTYTAFSNGELFFHPRCFERYQTAQQNESEVVKG